MARNLIVSLAAVFFLANAAQAATSITLSPSDDGALYTCSGCNTISHFGLLTAGYIEGDVKFSTAQITGPVSSAILTVTPVAFPVWEKNVHIYGFGSSVGLLDLTDLGAGSHLGIMDAWASPIQFDVTNFINGLSAPFAGFRLVTPNNIGADLFGSTHTSSPASLTFTLASPAGSVPEPASWALMIVGFTLAGAALRRGRKSGSALLVLGRA